jgi:hypothetical protein
MSGKTASVFSPATLGPKPETVEPIDKWIWENREAFPHEEQTQRGIAKLSRTQTYSGGRGISASVELTPQEYDRIQTLAGNEIKDPATGLGAKDTLNTLVRGSHPSTSLQNEWDEGSPAAKALAVQSIVQKFRGAAKAQIRSEFPDVEQAIQAGWDAAAAKLQSGPR